MEEEDLQQQRWRSLTPTSNVDPRLWKIQRWCQVDVIEKTSVTDHASLAIANISSRTVQSINNQTTATNKRHRRTTTQHNNQTHSNPLSLTTHTLSTMERAVAENTPSEDWLQSLNATCNRLSTQYLSLLKAASSVSAMEQGRPQDPRG